MLSGAIGEREAIGAPAAGSWLPAGLAVLVCLFLLGGTVLGFADLILATGRAETYFMFPATCH